MYNVHFYALCFMQELRTQVQMLMKKLEEMAAKLKGDAGLSLGTNAHEGHRKSTKDHKTKYGY